VTVLADNYIAAPDLPAEHGLSILIEAGDRRILAPCRCTGMYARWFLRARFNSVVQDFGVGATLEPGAS
jgi:metal-dependent hydrolase (beta-lactamase superfamily II)